MDALCGLANPFHPWPHLYRQHDLRVPDYRMADNRPDLYQPSMWDNIDGQASSPDMVRQLENRTEQRLGPASPTDMGSTSSEGRLDRPPAPEMSDPGHTGSTTTPHNMDAPPPPPPPLPPQRTLETLTTDSWESRMPRPRELDRVEAHPVPLDTLSNGDARWQPNSHVPEQDRSPVSSPHNKTPFGLFQPGPPHMPRGPPPPIAHVGHQPMPVHQHNLFSNVPPPPSPQGLVPSAGRQPLDSAVTSMSGGIPTPQVSSGSNNVSSSGLIVPQPMRQPRTIKTYHCRMCDQIFDNKSDLLVHSQQVHKADPKPYRCPQCHKCFANSSYLSQHARIHAGIKPYKCQICDRRFTQLCHLQQHIRTHTGEKPYKCQHPGCGKAFSQLSNLQSHSRSHMTDKPYRCNSCYKCYADEQSLREHIPKHSETKHLKTHICHICGKSYTQETYLTRHMSKHQGVDVSAAAAAAAAASSLANRSQQQMDIKPSLENSGLLSSQVDPRPSSAFLPLQPPPPQFPSPSPLLNPPSSFAAFGASSRLPGNSIGRLTPPPLPTSAANRYPFSFGGGGVGREALMDPPHGDVMANTLLSLQQIKNFNTPHNVMFPKSEPSSPALHKDYS